MRSIAFSGHQNTFAFVGDNRLKNMYEAFRKHFYTDNTGNDRDRVVLDPLAKQSNLTFSDKVLRLQADFVWAPFISNYVFDLLNNWKVIKTIGCYG